jgi:ectoine hydroxylase-related dioxygenase (phytanoyl-CoA dioxygenase family)
MSDITERLTQAQVDQYHRDGFIRLERIATDEEILRLRKAYDRIFAEQAGRESGDQFDLAGTDEEGQKAVLPQILNPAKYAPELAVGDYLGVLNTIVKQLLGPEAEAGVAHAIFKPARYGAMTPWHQDEAYWEPSLNYTSLSIWMPLQDVKVETGCMQFIPGSHKQEIIPHHSVNNDPRIHALVCEADDSKAVACPLSMGGCTLHDSRTLHFAGANVSEVDRRALILGAGLPTTPRTDGRRFIWNEIKETARQKREEAART